MLLFGRLRQGRTYPPANIYQLVYHCEISYSANPLLYLKVSNIFIFAEIKRRLPQIKVEYSLLPFSVYVFF
jgi:hypothetical protein